MTTTVQIPADLLPSDGRFGAGPSKVRDRQLAGLAASGHSLMGTSHRKPPVKNLVHQIRSGIRTLFDLPEDYEVLLGNGGATAMWDALALGLIRERSAHGAFGEFGHKFAKATSRAPFLAEPVVTTNAPGGVALPTFAEGVDVYAWPQNETSTGAAVPVHRVAGSQEQGALTVVDATSAAGGLPVDIRETDVYYFSPQKSFGSDGGLWLAVVSPRALDRIEEIGASDRWIPDFLSLSSAVTNSRADQTLNTPAIATLYLLADQLEWMNGNGGLTWAVARSAQSAATLYAWAERTPWAAPFVAAEHRSDVVVTIDLAESVEAAAVSAVLRENGIVDVDSYRKLGRNQLRVGTFPAVDPADVEALTACLDHVVAHLS